MIVEEVINKLVRDIINQILGIPNFAIKARQSLDNPRPVGAYADVHISSDISIGWEQRIRVDNINDDDISETIIGARRISISIGFYRDNSMDNARMVRTALNRNSILEIIKAANIGLAKRSDVRDISEVLETDWEDRAQFDLTLNATGSDEDIIRSIMNVDISADFQTSGKNIPTNIEVNT